MPSESVRVRKSEQLSRAGFPTSSHQFEFDRSASMMKRDRTVPGGVSPSSSSGIRASAAYQAA
jgi:hypothetical protein